MTINSPTSQNYEKIRRKKKKEKKKKKKKKKIFGTQYL
jgi:hypothetical protein